MNATVAKAARRDLRRAVGLEAAGVLDAHSACLDQQVLPNLQAMQARLAQVDRRLTVAERALRVTELRVADTAEGWRRSFWQRLRWLVTGA